MKIDCIFTRSFLFCFVIFVAFIVFFHRLADAPLSADGVIYAEIAKEMSISGDYLTPYQNGIIAFYTSKPPLLYWMCAFSGNIFGFNNFSAKFPVAILAFLSIIAMFLFVNKYYDFKTAFFSCIILIFTHQYLVYGRNCLMDGPFAVFFLFALMSFWIAKEENKNSHYYLMSVFISLAIMTKQALGLFICFVIFGYIFLAKDFKIFKNIHFWVSFLLVPVIILPWHIIMYYKYGMRFVNEYFSSTVLNVQGYTDLPKYAGYIDEDTVSKQLRNASIFSCFTYEWYAYLQKIVENYWPWLPFLFYGIYKKFKNIKQIYRNNKKDIFILTWIFIPMIILQMATRKNAYYITPLYPVFALICAEVITGFPEKILKRSIVILISVVTVTCIVFLSFPVIPNYLDRHKLSDPIKVIPAMKVVDNNEKIIVRYTDSYSYTSMFLFYADKNNRTLDNESFEKEIDSQDKKYFFATKDEYMNKLLKDYKHKINILSETKETVFFTNL
jgi:4-amino-4-deoxy-L-arabinose transferase-like glycosyltransferase